MAQAQQGRPGELFGKTTAARPGCYTALDKKNLGG